MKQYRNLMIVLALVAASLPIAACSKSDQTDDTAGKAESQEKKAGGLAEIAERAMAEIDFDEEGAGFRHLIEGAGYVPEQYNSFPTQELGKKGRMLLYARKGDKGGVIYIKKVGEEITPSWHWYFDDAAPKAVEKVDLNEDGLWDLRVETKKGDRLEFIQDESFSLMAKGRDDWIAMNGTSSS